MEFGEFVKMVREELDLSQTELAEAIDVSYATINRWENGRVIPSNLAKKSLLYFCECNFIDASQLSQ